MHQYWFVPTKSIEHQGPNYRCDLRAGAKSSSHFLVGDL